VRRSSPPTISGRWKIGVVVSRKPVIEVTQDELIGRTRSTSRGKGRVARHCPFVISLRPPHRCTLLQRTFPSRAQHSRSTPSSGAFFMASSSQDPPRSRRANSELANFPPTFHILRSADGTSHARLLPSPTH
jgi:hypothetical protein